MKFKYNLYIVITSILFFNFLSCASDDEVKYEVIDSNSVQTFRVKIKEGKATASTYDIKIIPSDDNIPYVTLVIPETTFVKISSENLKNEAMKEFKKLAEDNNQSIEEYLKSIEKKGEIDLKFKGLTPHTTYSLITFEIVGNDLRPYSANPTFYFATSVADKSDAKFEVSHTVDHLNVKININPSIKDLNYYVCVITKKQYNNLKEKGLSETQIITSHLRYNLERILNYSDTPFEEAIKTLLHQGDLSFQASPIEENADYICLVAGIVVPDKETFFVNTDLVSDSFTSGKSDLIDYNFDIKIENQTNTSFDIEITPQDEEITYLWRYQAIDSKTRNMTADELAKHIMKNTPFIGPWDKHKGVYSYNNLPLTPGNEYYVIAFGFSGKNVVTHAKMIKISTGEGADPNSITFKTNLNYVKPYSANITFIPSDNGVFYAFALLKDGVKTPEVLKKQFQEDLDYGYKAFQEFNKGLNKVDFLNSWYFKGVQIYAFDDLTPETNYTLYTLTINRNATVAKVEAYESYLTTPKLSDAKLNAQLFGVFDGNEIDSTIFTNPEIARGQAIVVAQYDFDKAKNGFAYMIPESFRKVELNVDKLSDQVILSKLKNDFVKVEKDQPYTFFSCTWDQMQVLLSYGVNDKDENGVINRMELVKPKKSNKDNIEKLRQLVKDIEGNNNKPASKKTVNIFKNFDRFSIKKQSEIIKRTKPLNVNNTKNLKIRKYNLNKTGEHTNEITNYIPLFTTPE